MSRGTLDASPMHTSLCYGVFTGYSRDVHGVFMEYSYVSGMRRVCIGYVSGMRRKKRGASGFFDNLVE